VDEFPFYGKRFTFLLWDKSYRFYWVDIKIFVKGEDYKDKTHYLFLVKIQDITERWECEMAILNWWLFYLPAILSWYMGTSCPVCPSVCRHDNSRILWPRVTKFGMHDLCDITEAKFEDEVNFLNDSESLVSYMRLIGLLHKQLCRIGG
jgi:hypothetical protein